MSSDKPMPTPEEIFQLLKRSSLPTAIVEGKDDIIFYRKIEESLRDLGIDMLPAGNKDNVLKVKSKVDKNPIDIKTIYIVDKDLWIHKIFKPENGLITTDGYSIENDIFIDGDMEDLLTPEEKEKFYIEIRKFTRWYALAVSRALKNRSSSSFRAHPNKILADEKFYQESCQLFINETYPEDLYMDIFNNYKEKLRGKSLFSLFQRQISSSHRQVKFATKQLMYIGSSRKGDNFSRMQSAVREALSG